MFVKIQSDHNKLELSPSIHYMHIYMSRRHRSNLTLEHEKRFKLMFDHLIRPPN